MTVSPTARQQGFLGLDETVASENPALYETPPLSLLLNRMPASRIKLPPAVDDIAREQELPALKDEVFDEEFYAENCVFELSAVAADGQGGLVVDHGSSRVFLKHVATSKYLAFVGEGETAQLILKDPDPGTAAPPPRSMLEIQPFFASRARGDHVQVPPTPTPPTHTHTHTPPHSHTYTHTHTPGLIAATGPCRLPIPRPAAAHHLTHTDRLVAVVGNSSTTTCGSRVQELKLQSKSDASPAVSDLAASSCRVVSTTTAAS